MKFIKISFKNHQKGQMLLLVILVMVVALTVGLSVATRNITNIKTTQDEENSQRAFSAAEAGIERALKSGQDVVDASGNPITLSNNAQYEAHGDDVDGPEFVLNGQANVEANEGVDVQLSDRNAIAPFEFTDPKSGTITVYWGGTDIPCDNAAIEVLVIEDLDSPTVKHYVYDRCTDPLKRSGVANNFNGSASDANGDKIEEIPFYSHTDQIPFTKGVIARVIPLYKGTKIGIKASIDLPKQETRFTATGSVGEGDNKVVRKISSSKKFPMVPNEFFQYLLLARNN